MNKSKKRCGILQRDIAKVGGQYVTIEPKRYNIEILGGVMYSYFLESGTVEHV